MISPSSSHTHTQRGKKNMECSFPFLISPAWELSWDTKEFNCFCYACRFSGYHDHKKSKGSVFGRLKEGSLWCLSLFFLLRWWGFLLPGAYSAVCSHCLFSWLSYKRTFDCSVAVAEHFFLWHWVLVFFNLLRTTLQLPTEVT